MHACAHECLRTGSLVVMVVVVVVAVMAAVILLGLCCRWSELWSGTSAVKILDLFS